MEFPRAIESPTASDLADKSIIELAQNVYNNALAVEENAAEVAATREKFDTAINTATTAAERAETAAGLAETDAGRAETAAGLAETDAGRAETAAERAEQAQTDAENTVDTKIAEFAMTVVAKPADTKPYFRIPILTSQGLIDYHPVSYSNPQDGYIPMFRPNGALVVGAPTADNHAANRQYVDDVLARANAFSGVGTYPNLICGRLSPSFVNVNSTSYNDAAINALYVAVVTCEGVQFTAFIATFANGRSMTFGDPDGVHGWLEYHNYVLTCYYKSPDGLGYGIIDKLYRLG